MSSKGFDLQRMINRVHLKDCVEGLRSLPSKIADIIICDPPYNIGKDFGSGGFLLSMDKYLDWCRPWISESLRVLKDDGSLFIYGFSENLAYVRTILDCNVRWLVWHYTNKNVPSINFWQRSHESILLCWKESYIFNRDSVREPYTKSFLKNSAGKKRKATPGRFGKSPTIYNAHKEGALPRDVLKIPALAGGAGMSEKVNHPTQKPLKLCERLLKSSRRENEDNLLIVPFAGSGSECVAAKSLGISYIGFEINPEYVNLCNQRLSQ